MNKKLVACLICLISLAILLSISPAKAAITTWYFEQILSGRDSIFYDFEYDSSGNPSIVTFDYTTKNVNYIYKTSSGWQTELVGTGYGSQPSLEYNTADPAGKASVLYLASDGLKYAVRNGANSWQTSTVDTVTGSDYIEGNCSLEFNGTKPSVSYIKTVFSPYYSPDLYYAYFDGTTWQKQKVDKYNDIGYPSLSFYSGKPSIAYDGGYSGLKYASWNGTAWIVETVDLPGDFGDFRNRYYNITLVFGNGTPYISYYDQLAEDLKFAYKSGSTWTVSALESTGDVGREAKMAISGTGADYTIYIAYNDFVINQNSRIMLKSMSAVNDTAFTTNVVYTHNFGNMPPYLGLAIDNGNPSFAFFDYWLSTTVLASMQPDITAVSSVNYGGVENGSSNSRDITITNNGSTNLTISQVELPAAPFTVTGSLGTTIASGESKVLTVAFNPLAVGTTYQGSIIIHSNDPDEKTFTIALNGHTYSNNADLSGLGLNIASDMVFNSGTTEYALTVLNSISNIRITPTAVDTYANIKVNNIVVQSGAASGNVALQVGLNSIPVLVTAEGGSVQKTYTLNITRKDSPNANLSGLSIGGGSLTPSFSQDITAYTVTLENTDAITILPTAAEGRAVITMNGGDTTTSPITFGVGTSTITFHVLAPDEETGKDYVLTVKRMPALSGLLLSSGGLNPLFNRDIQEYTATVPNAVNEMTITPSSVEDSLIHVNGEIVASGSASRAIALTTGENIITIEVKSGDTTLNKVYKLKVYRRPCLSSLSLSSGVLNTAFDPAVLGYLATVPNNINNIALTPGTVDGTIIKVNGNQVDSGIESTGIAIHEGSNTITIETISADGKATENYTLTVKRLPALVDLSLGIGTLDFDAEVFTYLVNVPNNITNITLTPEAIAGIKIEVNGSSLGSGTESPAIALDEGINTIAIEVISADDEASSTYTLAVKRLLGLNNLSMSTGTLGFKPDTFNYEVTVPYDTNNIKLIAEAPDGISIRIGGNPVDSGTESPEIALSAGKNIIAIDAISGDEGSTAYILAVKRLPALNSLSMNGETIELISGVTDYEVTVPNSTGNVILTPVAAGGIKIKVDGSLVESGAESPAKALHEGSNTVTIETISADEETAVTCTLAIKRLPGLSSLSVSTGTLTPEFDPDTLNYTANAPNSVASITLLPVSMEPGSSISVNDTVVLSGTASGEITLTLGRNDIITIKVTSSDGQASSSYKLSVYRAYPPAPAITPASDAAVTGSDTTTTLPVDVNNETGSVTVNLGALAGDFIGVGADDEIPVINVPAILGAIAYTLEMPVSTLADSRAGDLLTFSTETGSITIPGNMLDGITGASGKEAGITMEPGDKSMLTDEMRMAIGDRPIIQLTMTLDGEKAQWQNPEAPVTVSIPYTPTAEELDDSEHIVVWYIDGTGNVVSVPNGRYDTETGVVTFATTHFSQYTIAYVQKTFGDLNSVNWARKPIEVLASKGVLKGISEKEYAPQTNITRADFLYFLVRTLGVDAKVDGNFDDISTDAYYFREIAVAKKLGITDGTGNNKFSPDESITRQDMMVLTERALRMLKMLKEQGAASDLKKFADKSLVAAYAQVSVASVVKEGLIEGSGSRVNPLGNTTRAEAAMFLYRIYNKY